MSLRTRRAGSFEVFSPSLGLEIADSPTVDASRTVFEAAGVDPKDVDVAQVQDTESGAELIHLADCPVTVIPERRVEREPASAADVPAGAAA